MSLLQMLGVDETGVVFWEDGEASVLEVPRPGASEDGQTWTYDHATGAMVWTDQAAGGGGAPTGPAGGVLSGSYPDPGFAADMASQAELEAVRDRAAASPVGLADGGFVRRRTTPVVDRSSASLGFRDPGIDAEYVGGVPEFTIIGALQEESGVPASFHGDIGYAQGGPEPENATYQGLWLTRPEVGGVLAGGATPDYLGPSGYVREGGTWYTFVVAAKADFTEAKIVRLQSASKTGPWTNPTVVVEVTGTPADEDVVLDNCKPVWYPPGGVWVMVMHIMDNAAPLARKLVVYTAPTLNGTWTRFSPLPIARGGFTTSQLSGDSPMLMMDGPRRLILFLNDLGGRIAAYDFTDLQNALYLGPAFQIPQPFNTSGSIETGAEGWGGGGICRLDNRVFLAYWGQAEPDVGTYPKTFVAEFVRGRTKVNTPGQLGQGAPTMAAGLSITTNTDTTIAVPSWLPAEAYALDLLVQSRNQGTTASAPPATPSERVLIDGAPTIAEVGPDAGAITLYSNGVNVMMASRGEVPFSPNRRSLFAHTIGLHASANVRLTVSVLGYWRLP